jgi:glycosyltransferase involved in cell wall biosynthesis
VTPEERVAALASADAVITGNELSRRELLRFRGYLIADVYDPRMFQLLASDLPAAERGAIMRDELPKQRQLWRHADMLLCATTYQRDLYLGACLASAPMSTLVDGDEAAWNQRVVVLPNGVDQTPPVADPSIRAEMGVDPDDILLIWGGGVWDWMDPGLLVRALVAARADESRLKILFLGLKREGRPLPMSARNAGLLAELAQHQDAVVVSSDWVAPERRGAYLVASDAGALVQRVGLEAHFSFRQRVGDCAWAGLPIIATGGDPLCDEVAAQGWGLVSPAGDEAALRDNLIRFAADVALRRDMRTAAEAARPAWAWDRVCAPLVEAIQSLPAGGELRRMWRGVGGIPAALLGRVKGRLQ